MSRAAASAAAGLHAAENRALSVLVWSFGFLLATGIIHGIVLHARFGSDDFLTDRGAESALHQIAVVEAIDTAIVIWAFVALAASGARPQARDRRTISAWIAALPLLAIMLGINFVYHEFLRDVLRLPLIEDEILETSSWLALVAICVQPAIVEEMYCRSLAMNILRGVTGRHAAVWISAVMFALLHVAALFSLPYLFLVGLFLGYLRLAGGTVWLPVVVHFLHNLAVLLKEWN
jgi:membrane protease YdiL (CAAX protease family)